MTFAGFSLPYIGPCAMSGPMTVAVLIVAAGRGHRVGGDLPKQYRDTGGKPVLSHTLGVFAAHPEVGQILVVIHPDDRALYESAVGAVQIDSLLDPVLGGETRQESVRAGLEALVPFSPDRVLIHDGARPFIEPRVISEVIAALDDAPGAIAATKLSDTLKKETADSGSGVSSVAHTLDRAGLWRAQTPQGFQFEPILVAHRAVSDHVFTDDAAIAENQGLRVVLVESGDGNFKITTPDDIARAEQILMAQLTDIRVGSGFDVHKFSDAGNETNRLMLCGVEVPHERSLLGHSDADVGLHAITDAILGALGAGDIGEHFPPSDPQWKGAESHMFLAHAGDLVRKAKGQIGHVDVTLICEAPKVGPHREAMTRRIAEILDISSTRVSVKATTTEGLGFTGRREGIAAQATATIRLPNS